MMPLQDQINLPVLCKPSRRFHASALHLLDRNAEQPRHLARMRRQQQRAVICAHLIHMRREQIYAVCVDHQRAAAMRQQRTEQPIRSFVDAAAAAEQRGRRATLRRTDRFRFIRPIRQINRLPQRARQNRIQCFRHRQLYQSAAAAQCAGCGQRRCTGHPVRAANAQRPAKAALVAFLRPLRQNRRNIRRIRQAGIRLFPLRQRLRHADIHHRHAAAEYIRRRMKMHRLGTDERQRVVRTKRKRIGAAGVALGSAGQIERNAHHRPAIDAVQHRRRPIGQRAMKPDAIHAVHHHRIIRWHQHLLFHIPHIFVAGQLFRRLRRQFGHRRAVHAQNVDRTAVFRKIPRRDISVSAVIAFSAQNQNSAVRCAMLQNPARRPCSGTAHQHTQCVAVFRRCLLNSTHLRRRVNMLHPKTPPFRC